MLRDHGMPVDWSGEGTVCEVYPAASRSVWELATEVRDLPELLSRISVQSAEQDGLMARRGPFPPLPVAGW